MTELMAIGTKRREMCYDGVEHETTLTDYLVRLTGNTYQHRGEIYQEGFQWDDMDKAWYKNVEFEDELNRLCKKFSQLVTVSIKPIFRITD